VELETPRLEPFQLEHARLFHSLPIRKQLGAMKMILDELKAVRGSVPQSSELETTRIEEVEVAICRRFVEMESAAKVFDNWKP